VRVFFFSFSFLVFLSNRNCSCIQICAVRTLPDEVDTLVISTDCTKNTIEVDRKQIKNAAQQALTIVISKPSKLPTKNCQVVYKSKVASGTAASIAEAISNSRRRARLLGNYRRLASREISSSAAQEEVGYDEKSMQEFVEEPFDCSLDNSCDEQVGGTKTTTPSAADSASDIDDDDMSTKLSSSTKIHLATIATIVTVLVGIVLC
jgi:hypothetical protein